MGKPYIRRLRKIIYVLKKISPEQFSVFKQWLKNIVKPRLKEEMQEEVDDVLNKSNQEEVDVMVSNLGKTLDNIQKKAIERGMKQGIEQGIEKGIEKKAREIAVKAIKMGMDNSVVVELTGLREDEIDIIRKEISH